MLFYVLGFSILVSVCNIGLNYFASKAAGSAGQWSHAFQTVSFAIAFAVGAMSLACMVTLYHFAKGNQFGLSSGILTMGTTSIIGGTLFGYFVLKNEVSSIEWILLLLLVVTILLRFGLAVAKTGMPAS